jgi:hypothetical protein
MNDQAELPRFKKPPVSEVALGVQFAAILTPVHLGLYYEKVTLSKTANPAARHSRLRNLRDERSSRHTLRLPKSNAITHVVLVRRRKLPNPATKR